MIKKLCKFILNLIVDRRLFCFLKNVCLFIFLLSSSHRLSEKDLTLVWSNRNWLPTLLSPCARGLPILTQSIPSNSYSEDLNKFHTVLSLWPVCEPSHGLELLDAQYSDIKVRLKAMEMISEFSEDDFVHLLPQILQVSSVINNNNNN